ncbi:hypothetical protein [Methylobacterium sp. AMS5]|uniref:hypothetical protein n=1 Tax=Methylobacterium sp. AMS5 TaxID=925818 RepID=UPI00074F8800|nr:hypothetical protein [Methylobacterium sp. AMS5]AMB48238.1 hypothetical protein Y590_25050 [Methylobacterium sp. AMS5]
MKQPSRPVAFEQRSPGQRPKLTVKPPSWNHQHELKAHRGKEITLVHVDGLRTSGTLEEADQFTIKVRSIVAGSQSSVTYFKHDVCGYILSEEA